MRQPQDQHSRKPGLFPVLRVPLLTAVLFVGVTSFAILLSSNTLHDFSRETRLSAYQGLGEQLRFGIERGLRFGRPLDGYAGLGSQLDNAVGIAGDVVGIAVTGMTGNSLYRAGFGGGLDNRTLLPGDLPFLLAGDDVRDEWLDVRGNHVLLMPIRGRERTVEGSLLLVVDGESTLQDYRRYMHQSIFLVLCLTGALLLIQSGWAARLLRFGRDRRGQRALYLTLLLFVGGGQIAFFIPSAIFFHDALTASETAKVTMTGRMLSQDLERLVYKGLRLEQVRGVAAHFDEIRENTPEIAAMRLVEGDLIVADSGAEIAGGGVVEMPVNQYWPDRHTPAKAVAKLEIRTDPTAVNAALNRIYLNQLTVMIVSLLLLVELCRILVAIRPDSAALAPEAYRDAAAGHHTAVIRMLTFLFFFGYDMVLSFVPLTARSLPGSIRFIGDFLGESQLAALPITMEALAGGAGILLAARISRRLDTRKSLLLGIGFAMAGMYGASMAADIGMFVLARAAAGLGFGLVLMLSQIALVQRQAKADGLAQMYSGLFAGSICGVATGAMASELVGFQNVFAFSTILFVIALPLLRSIPPAAQKLEDAASGNGGFFRTAGFFLSAEFLVPVALATLPIAVSLAGFINFGMPVELNRLGAAQGDIGRLFMIYGLCFVLFGSLFARLADRSGKYLACVSFSAVVNALALFSAWSRPDFTGFALAALMAGVANCLLSSSAMVYILRGKRARLQECETVGSVYRMVERCGHMAGPLIFSLLLAQQNAEAGLLWLSAAFCAAAVVLFLARRTAKG